MGDHLRGGRDARAGHLHRDQQRRRVADQRDPGRGQRRLRRHDESGTTAVEFAFIGPLLLLLIFAIISAGLYFYGRNVALTAAREGVSYLRLAGTNADPDAFVVEAERVSEIYARDIGILKGANANGTIDEDTGQVTMTVTGLIDVPGMEPQIDQTVTATLEQFRGDVSDEDVLP